MLAVGLFGGRGNERTANRREEFQIFVSRWDCMAGAGMREGLTEEKNFKSLLAMGSAWRTWR